MALDRRVADQLALEEDGHHDRGVLRVRAGPVGLVVEDDVARLELVDPAHAGHGRVDAEVHRAHEQRQARRLRQQPDLVVVDRDGEVQDLVDDRRERGADQRALHLVGGRVEAVADDLGGDRVGVGDAARGARPRPGGRRSRSRSCLALRASGRWHPDSCDAAARSRGRCRRSRSPPARSPGPRCSPRPPAPSRWTSANVRPVAVGEGVGARCVRPAPRRGRRRCSTRRARRRSAAAACGSSRAATRSPPPRPSAARRSARTRPGSARAPPRASSATALLVAGQHGQRVLLADVAHVERGLARRAGRRRRAPRGARPRRRARRDSALASASPASSSGGDARARDGLREVGTEQAPGREVARVRRQQDRADARARRRAARGTAGRRRRTASAPRCAGPRPARP